MLLRLRVLFLLLVFPGWGLATPASDELLVIFKTKMDAGDNIGELLRALEELDPASQKDIVADLNRAWPTVRQQYLDALSKRAASPPDRASQNREIKTHRQDFLRVYALPEDAMKEPLKAISMPAVKALRELLAPDAATLVKQDPELAKRREMAVAMAKFRDAALTAHISTTPSDSLSSLEGAESEALLKASPLPKPALRLLAQNRQIAEKNDIPSEEARGIEECNLWRLYVGLNALVLDPKLCAAARDHSKDMQEQDFFAHVSPVKGKTSFSDRAKNFGTTASGENIYMGSSQASAANEGWFFSPGHHKNMFRPGHKRIGLGKHGNHWTQMFGG